MIKIGKKLVVVNGTEIFRFPISNGMKTNLDKFNNVTNQARNMIATCF